MSDQSPAVLVVEDEEDLASLLVTNLELSGHTARVASDGELALAMIAADPPDVVLLDVMMPGIDGWTVLRRLKANPITTDLPVIMLTALGSEHDVLRGHLTGAAAHLTKPFEMQALLTAIDDALLPMTPEDRAARREQTKAMLQRLAEISSGRRADPSVRLTGLERARTGDGAPPRRVTPAQREQIVGLTAKQRWLAAALAAGWSVRAIATHLDVSRSNVYATRRRVARRLGVPASDVGEVAEACGLADEAGPPPEID